MNWRTKKILTDFITVILVVAVMCAMMAGCASIPTAQQCEATKWPTEEALTECIKNAKAEADRQYEREDRRIIEVDKIVGKWNWCKANNLLVLLDARNLSRGEMMKMQRIRGTITHDDIPKRLRLIRVRCVEELRIVQ